MNRRAGVALGESHDVVKICTAPRVDTLRIVTHGHDLVVHAEDVDDLGLQAVGILKFVDQNVLEALLILRRYLGVLAQELEQVFEQIIVVDNLML